MSVSTQPSPRFFRRHLDDAFDAADGGVQQRADSLAVVHAVRVPHAHEDDVSRKSGDEAAVAIAVAGGLQVLEEHGGLTAALLRTDPPPAPPANLPVTTTFSRRLVSAGLCSSMPWLSRSLRVMITALARGSDPERLYCCWAAAKHQKEKKKGALVELNTPSQSEMAQG